MFNIISFEKLLEVTAEDLAVIKNNLGAVYGDETIDSETKNVALATAFNTIDSWSSYFSRFKEVQDSKIDELTRANSSLANENKRLNNENKVLVNSNNEILNKNNILTARVEYLEQVLAAKDNSSNLVSIDLVDRLDRLDEAIKIIYENAKTIAYRGNVKEFKPAKRIDISDDDIRNKYLAGETAYKIAKDCGLTAGAIVYRLKQMGIYKRKE